MKNLVNVAKFQFCPFKCILVNDVTPKSKNKKIGVLL